MKQILTFSFIIALLALGCSKDDGVNPSTQRSIDSQVIQQYLADNNLTADSTASGLHYIITDPGSGNAHPELSSTVQVKYKGYLTNGTVFDQTQPGQSISFPLNGVIEGWKEGIRLFTKGGKGVLLVPSYLGYGPGGSGSAIPPNTVLVFDIELIDF